MRLHGKVGRILQGVSALAVERWPELAWPQGQGVIRKELTRRFWEHLDLLVLVQPRGRAGVVYVALGVVPGEHEAEVCIDVGTYPSQVDLQRELITLADAAAMSAAWQRSHGNWGGLRVTERLVTLGDQPSAEAWFLDGLAVLGDAGILRRIGLVGGAGGGVVDTVPGPVADMD